MAENNQIIVPQSTSSRRKNSRSQPGPPASPLGSSQHSFDLNADSKEDLIYLFWVILIIIFGGFYFYYLICQPVVNIDNNAEYMQFI
eukprot:UN08619